MYKYVLKIATLDESLIVKQKARMLSHLLDNQDSLQINVNHAKEEQKLIETEPEIKEPEEKLSKLLHFEEIA